MCQQISCFSGMVLDFTKCKVHVIHAMCGRLFSNAAYASAINKFACHDSSDVACPIVS